MTWCPVGLKCFCLSFDFTTTSFNTISSVWPLLTAKHSECDELAQETRAPWEVAADIVITTHQLSRRLMWCISGDRKLQCNKRQSMNFTDSPQLFIPLLLSVRNHKSLRQCYWCWCRHHQRCFFVAWTPLPKPKDTIQLFRFTIVTEMIKCLLLLSLKIRTRLPLDVSLFTRLQTHCQCCWCGRCFFPTLFSFLFSIFPSPTWLRQITTVIHGYTQMH